jgi:hypothetical protein
MEYTKSPRSSLKGNFPTAPMKSFRRSLRVLTLPIVLSAVSATVAAQDHVIIQPKRVVIIRTGKEVRDSPDRRKAIVRYPIIKGLSNAIALRRIQNTLSLKNASGSSLAEFRREPGLLSFDYKVNYNRNYLLDITFSGEAMGAYPETYTKHFLISLESGKVLKAADVFNPQSFAALAHLADQKLKDEITELLQANEEDKSSDADERSMIKEQLSGLKFGVKNLDEFSASDKGVTFLYDAHFRHAIRALEPDGEYFFSYAELRHFIKRNGPLGTLK